MILLLLVDATLLAVAELMFLPLYIGQLPVPVSALVAGLSLPWLVWQAGKFGGTPLTAALPLVVWTVTIGLLGFAGPGDDMLLPTVGPMLFSSVLLVVAGLVPGTFTLARVAREMAQRPQDWPEDERASAAPDPEDW